MHRTSIKNMERFFKEYLKDGDRIIDIGSSHPLGERMTYGEILLKNNCEYIGLDIREGPNVDIVVKDPYKWSEIDDGSFDIAVSGQTFEHIEFFWLTFSEMVRVVKEGGKMCIIAPSYGPIHVWENVNPYDCWRFQPDGMKALAKSKNIKCLKAYLDPFDLKWRDCIGIFENTKVGVNE